MTATPESIAEVLVEPEGLDWEATSLAQGESPHIENGPQDPLLALFASAAGFSRENLALELQKHRLEATAQKSYNDDDENTIPQRREPRIAVSLPVEVWDEAHQESSEGATSMIDVSDGGARIEGVRFDVKPGEVVHLVSAGVEAKFRVIWVGESGSAHEGQIGLQSLKTDDFEIDE
jgi:hypothetical protein